MSYDAVPLQALAQAVIVENASAVPSFVTQKGFSAVSSPGTGLILLTLDPGLIGNAGEVAVGASDIRSTITMRGLTSTGLTNIVTTSVAYITPSTGTGADGGDTQVEITFLDGTGALINPTPTNAGGVEILLWRRR